MIFILPYVSTAFGQSSSVAVNKIIWRAESTQTNTKFLTMQIHSLYFHFQKQNFHFHETDYSMAIKTSAFQLLGSSNYQFHNPPACSLYYHQVSLSPFLLWWFFSNNFSLLWWLLFLPNLFHVPCCDDGTPSHHFSLSISRWISCASFGTSFCVGCSFYLVTL